MDEALARRILQAAISEGRCAALLSCLFEGGSATVDPDGKLVLASADVIAALIGQVER